MCRGPPSGPHRCGSVRTCRLQVRGDEGPEKGASGAILLAHSRLVRVDVQGQRHEREGGVVERSKLIRAPMDKVAHRAPRDGNASVLVGLLKAVLRNRVAALADDEVRDEAQRVARLLAERSGAGAVIPASISARLTQSPSAVAVAYRRSRGSWTSFRPACTSLTASALNSAVNDLRFLFAMNST
jgi:hypothetical protein